MENYNLANTTPVEICEPLHKIQLDSNVIHMNVKTGSKVANLTSFACRQLEKDDQKQITWNGTGDALNKVVACAEILKKRFKNLYQINKIGFTKTEDIWNAKLENLRDIKVVKELPTICIILSKTSLDSNESGFQTSKTIEDMFNKKQATHKNQSMQKKNGSKSANDANNDADDSIYVKKKKFKNKTDK